MQRAMCGMRISRDMSGCCRGGEEKTQRKETQKAQSSQKKNDTERRRRCRVRTSQQLLAIITQRVSRSISFCVFRALCAFALKFGFRCRPDSSEPSQHPPRLKRQH